MRKRGNEEEESQGAQVGPEEEENVDWEAIWNRSLRGNDVPPALRGVRCVHCLSIARSSHRNPYTTTGHFVPRKQDLHTIITLTDNAPQGLNESLSAFPLATKVRPRLRLSTFHKAINHLVLFPS
jgi:hypothetical protein